MSVAMAMAMEIAEAATAKRIDRFDQEEAASFFFFFFFLLPSFLSTNCEDRCWVF